MRRILILSYFFPPCNLTASQRIYSWARYLNEFGYYPIVITRRWDRDVQNLNDLSFPTGKTVIHNVFPEFEVYYVPYEPNLRDRIYSRFGEHRFSEIRKTLSLAVILLQDIFTSFIPFHNLYYFARVYLKKEKEIKAIITSGNPYVLFKFGYLLHKNFHIPWVADYRDAWSTSEINIVNRGKVFGWINNLERLFEKKWCSTASAITANSAPILQKILALTNVNNSLVLENGFVEEEMPEEIPLNSSQPFTITYVGTLFNGQRVEIFADAFRDFVKDKIPSRVRLIFPGLAFYPEQEKRLRSAFQGLEAFLDITTRRPRQDVLMIEKQSHVLLHFAWKDYHGVIASKIYEYIGMGRPIIICPSDQDEIEKMLKPYNLAYVCNTSEDALRGLHELFSHYERGSYAQLIPDKTFQKQFTRHEQTKRLAKLFDKFLYSNTI